MSIQFLPSSPDWGIYPGQQPGTEPDLGEVAARLGGLSTYRRTGRLLWAWDTTSFNGWTGTGAVYSINSQRIWMSPASLILQSGGVSRIFPPFTQTLGIEAMLSPKQGGFGHYPTETWINLYHYTLPHLALFTLEIYWDLAVPEIRLGTGGLPVTIMTLPAMQSELWHNLKFTLNLQDERYGWVYFDDQSANVSTIAPFTGVPPGAVFDGMIINNNPALPDNATCYITNLMITTNEVVS